MSGRRVLPSLFVVAALCGYSERSPAQTAARSQLGTVTQSVAGTRIEVVYRRPVARGRPLFGALVPWGRIWTPSADSAARMTISAPVVINGASLAAGTYGIWTIPDSTSWTVIFSGTAPAHHLHYPDGHDVLRVHAAPQHGDHVESLLFAFPMVDADSAVLQLRWGTTIVPLSIRAATDGAR
ncbi:MAG: DUF2911 domain-containing protein [bacterium]